MINCSITQRRLPEHFGWEVTVTAHLDFELSDEIGLVGEDAQKIDDALEEVFHNTRKFRTEASQDGWQIAQLSGILFKNFFAFEPEDLDEVMEKEVCFGEGTFDAMGGSHLAARFLRDWLETEDSVHFIDWENYRPGGIFACDTLVCAPGVKLYPILCMMLAELESYVGGLESILAIHQAFSTEDLSGHEAMSAIASQSQVPELALEHGFRGEVLSKGARAEGRKITKQSHLGGLEVSVDPKDLATTVFALEDSEFNRSKRLWPINATDHPDRVTYYLDPLAWAEHELGLREHARPAGSDLPR